MKITESSLDTLKQQIDIVDIIGESLELRKSGGNYKACCPFHGEKTPSFVVSASKQIYKCFGCGVGGDAIKFVMETDRLSFVEAVEKIAVRYNYTLDYEGGQSKNYSRTLEAMQLYFAGELREEDGKYLKGRGIGKREIKKWGIGYAPRSPQQLKAIDEMMLPKDDLLELSILREGERGVYAHFTDRIMIPIRDHRGKVVGWSGRSLRSEIKAKYVNSMQSVVFDKSRLLFGLDQAKEAIYKKRFAIIMEGQLDIVMAHKAGIQTAVGSQGTALTASHLHHLKKARARVVLAYDGDKAGRAAALKAAMLLSAHQIAGGVVLLPEGSDPADMVAAGEAEALKELLKGYEELIGWVLRQIISGHNLSDPYAKSAAVAEATAYLESLGDPIVADGYRPLLAQLTGVDREHVPQIADSTAAAPPTQRYSTEEQLLYTLYMQPRQVDTALDIVDPAAWQNQARWQQLLDSTADDQSFAEIILKDGITEMDDKSLLTTLRAKQRAYLIQAKQRAVETGNMQELMRINAELERMK